MQTRCHLSVLIREQAKKYGERIAIYYREFGSKEWETVSWNKFYDKVKSVSYALLSLGVKVQENVGVFSQNCARYLYTDFGAYGIRAVTIPFYATSSEQQIKFMLEDAQVRYIFVGEQEQYDKAYNVQMSLPSLQKIIVFDKRVKFNENDKTSIHFDDFLELGDNYAHKEQLEELYSQANLKDLCNILYTSGTTGNSKGVMLDHEQYLSAMIANDNALNLSEKDKIINFLPFTHIFERGWAILSISEGCQLIVNTYPNEIQKSMKEMHPTCMSSVPRFWEKVYAGVQDKIHSSSAFQQKIFNKALEIGREYNIDYKNKCKKAPFLLELKYKVIDKLFLSLVRKELGLEKPNFFPTAGAAVSADVEDFVNSIGISMKCGYGLTESLATVSCDRDDRPCTSGSVGYPLDEVEVKIGKDNEVLLKGPTITKGYYKRDDLNKEVFTEDGFFRTGDSGYFNKHGELFLTERIKDLFKTSNGKYIAPQMIESKMLVDMYIEQIAVIADQRKFVSALIIPNYELLEKYARNNDIAFSSREELCENKQIHDMLMKRIVESQQHLAGYEQIKRFTLLPHAFSIKNGEITNTLKIKRAVINKKYADVIDKMYEE